MSADRLRVREEPGRRFCRGAVGGRVHGSVAGDAAGVARALKDYDPALETALRDYGFPTRDPREVERKKHGQAGARKRFQFSTR